MSFIPDALDVIPGSGHARAAILYATGDKSGVEKILYKSNRSSAMAVGGAVGALAGPAGSAAGSFLGACVVDVVTSLATGREEGYVRDIHDVANDVERGEVPVMSALSTGARVVSDTGVFSPVRMVERMAGWLREGTEEEREEFIDGERRRRN